ncbi:MAG: hypothetical protein CVU84_14685 [Firmicutes bacterium HGW-Firmicutes-1]|jgi:hypothetical protein|nr:MAG: hypothetical protein CVU84_14685 [Firmicutes bacterium HGW-Firmicutes-1]
MKKIFIIFLAIFLVGCSPADKETATKKDTNTNIANYTFSTYNIKLGIATKDLVLKDPYFITIDGQNNYVYKKQNSECKLQKNDLLLVIEEEEEYYRVEVAFGDVPRSRGYVDKDEISFNEALFEDANQVRIEQAMTYDSKNGKEIDLKSGTGSVEEREGEWILLQLPGGGSAFWIKTSSLNFNLDAEAELLDISIVD